MISTTSASSAPPAGPGALALQQVSGGSRGASPPGGTQSQCGFAIDAATSSQVCTSVSVYAVVRHAQQSRCTVPTAQSTGPSTSVKRITGVHVTRSVVRITL